MFRTFLVAATFVAAALMMTPSAEADHGRSSRYRPSYAPTPHRYIPSYRAGSVKRYIPSYQRGRFGSPVVVPGRGYGPGRSFGPGRSYVPRRSYGVPYYRSPYSSGFRGPGVSIGTRGFSLYLGR